MVISKRSLLLAGAAFPASAFAQCVINAPAVDACLGGVRNAGPAGATLDLNFMFPGSLDPRITFTRASSATYTDASGVIQTAASNAPRWDYANGVLRGLLIEEARTNQSKDYTGYGVSGASWTPASGIAPDATNTMVRWAETNLGGAHYSDFSGPSVANASYTFSVYAKMQQIRYLQLFVDNAGGSAGGFATYDLQNGVVSGPLTSLGAGALGGATIIPVGNGVYRLTLTTSIGVGTTIRSGLVGTNNVAAPGFAPSYTGNAANGLLIWGLQLEQGAFATSYISTVAASVTRARDSCVISPANMAPWFASPGGSWLAEFISAVPTPITLTSPRIIGPNSAGVTPLWVSTGMNVASFDGAVIATPNVFTVASISKGASTWASGNGKVCLNGGAIGAGAQATGFASLASTGISVFAGNPGTVNETMSGHIRRIQYWPRVLTDAEMQQVTT